MAKRSKSSLLDEAAAEESAAPSLFLVSTEEEGNRTMERRGEFTAERLMESRPTIYRAIVDGLGQGLGVRQLCRAYRVSHHTVAAVMARESQAVATLKERTVSVLRTFGRLAADRLLDEVDNIPIQSLPIALGIAVEKAELLAGGATSRIEHTEPGPTHDDYLRMISGKVIEAEIVQATGLTGEEESQKGDDQDAAGVIPVQADPFEAQAGELVDAAGPESGIVLALPAAAENPTGSLENPSPSDEQSGVFTGSDSVEAGDDTHLDTQAAGSEGSEDAPLATQEPRQRVEANETTGESARKKAERKKPKRTPKEGGRGSAKLRGVSRGH